MGGCYRFLQRVWNIARDVIVAEESSDTNESLRKELRAASHGTIKRVSRDLSEMGFNTAIAAMMEEVNELYRLKTTYGIADTAAWREVIASLVQLLAPFAPHITEELWSQLGNNTSVHLSPWPKHEEKYLLTDTETIVVQVNGKLRATLQLPRGSTEQEVVAAAMADAKVTAFLDGATVKKTIYIPSKLVNIVI